MTRDPNDVVRVYSGSLVDTERYREVLTDAGIEGRVVGGALLASFGSALPDSVELWVHREDLDRAVAAIKLSEERRAEPAQAFPHPADDRQPVAAPFRREPHVKQDPLGE